MSESVDFGPCSIYDDGRIFSKISNRFISGRVGNHGYRYVTFYGENWLVHRLVAMAFLKTTIKREVNHIDGNKLNNVISNLEWVSKKENMDHAKRSGLIGKRKSKIEDMTILTLRTLYPARKITSKEAESLGLRKDRISSINTRDFLHIPKITVEEIEKERHL